MNIKESLRKVFDRFVVINLSAMLAVVILLCIGVAFGLDLYTHHGENIAVPNLKGVDVDKAERQLYLLGLDMVVNDSGYNKQMAADCILLQTPGPGQRVKKGHIIYVTVNSPSSPSFAIPDIIDNCSVREAEARLTAMGFRLNPHKMVDGEKDWVYGIQFRGRNLVAGDGVPRESELTLVIGNGMAGEDMEEPNQDDEGLGDDFVDDVDDFLEVEE